MLHKYAWDDIDPANPVEVDQFSFREESPKIDPSIMDKLKKTKIGKIGPFIAYRVDGEYIRNWIDQDYVGGGNFARDTYIPLDEIWLETSLRPSDLGPTLVHEAVEVLLMTKMEVEYESSHDFANIIEGKFRRRLRDKELKIKTDKDALKEANKVLKRFLEDATIKL
jgi:hypothetical protein